MCTSWKKQNLSVLKPHSISLVCACVCFVLKKTVVQFTMLSTNKTSLPPKLDLPTATSMHWGHLDTYICYHITLTFSKVFIRLTTIKTTNCTCNTQSKKKKNRQCNISNVAILLDSTYEISHLILQYSGNQYTKRLTQGKVCGLSHISGEQRKHSWLFHAQQLTKKFSLDSKKITPICAKQKIFDSPK